MMRLLVLLVSLSASAFATAESFLMQNLDAERVDLLDYVGSGKWTLVMFWTTDCVPCEQQKPMIEAFHREQHESRARVVGVALDGHEQIDAIEALVQRHNPSYPTLVAFTDVFERQYTAHVGSSFRATPTYLLYAPDGSLGGSHTGPISRAALDAAVGN